VQRNDLIHPSVLFYRVRIWDVIILVPNLLFLLFIAMRFNRARLKLRATSSPIFLAFYGLVICNVVISVVRCFVSMTMNAVATVGDKADKVLWVTVRFFLLSTEMSVVIFGLAFGEWHRFSSREKEKKDKYLLTHESFSLRSFGQPLQYS